MNDITAYDRRAKALRVMAQGFEAALKETGGGAVVGVDDGTGAFEVMLIDDAHVRTRTFWFAVADEGEDNVVEYAPAWYDLELGQRTSMSTWTDLPGLFEAFARWLREEATP